MFRMILGLMLGNKNRYLYWSKKQKAVYVRDESSGAFALDVSKSDFIQGEIDDVYNIDSLTQEGFLNYNHNKLIAIAKGSNPLKKVWLRKYLESCKCASPDLQAAMK